MLEQEFGALEALGQLLTDRLLDHTRASKADQSAGFCKDHVAQHRVARRDAAGGRVGQNRNVGEPRLFQQSQAGRRFGHLHQGEGAFHHAGATRGGNNHQRFAELQRPVHSASHLFTHHRAHAAADEGKIHHRQDGRDGFHPGRAGDDRLVQAGLLFGVFQAVRVPLAVLEAQRVHGLDVRVELLEGAFVGQKLDVVVCANSEVELAVGAHELVPFQLAPVDDLTTLFALQPEPIRQVFLLLGRQPLVRSTKPGH